MSYTDKVKRFLKSQYDLDFIGIADPGALESEPEGHRPTDLLPGAKSIIVFGRAYADGAIQGQFRAFEDHVTAAQSGYAAYASDIAPNFLMVNVAFEIARYLEDYFDAISVPVPYGPQQSLVWDSYPAPIFCDPYGQGAPLNVAQAALAAGLGEYGWSNRFLTPDYGPRIVLMAVITSLELDCDSPYDGPTLCDPKACGICSKICPTHALPDSCSGECVVKSVAGKSQEVSAIKPESCAVASMAMRKEFQGRIPVPDQIMVDDPSVEELHMAFKSKPVNPLSVDHYPRYFCDRCLLYCPVGKWQERYYDRGLTTFNSEAEMTHC